MTENKQNNFVLRNSRLSNNNKTLSKPVSAGNDKHLISGYDIEWLSGTVIERKFKW